ncbi:CHC2 zinc finger domain-containing protein [Nitrospira moscoviensis]|uniref:Zinc finger CHC2-type domain-containing protein n=1 Tax=Nitrospira moscoviensis TaxID=42253 RepID=A0A0K2GGL9_NITMO|nr:CHC2 zinc finger domain-containing protein [Nitrospira moscoviensis]ALA59979.1 exported protein of unknown function [Nitrospira moscoviensis]
MLNRRTLFKTALALGLGNLLPGLIEASESASRGEASRPIVGGTSAPTDSLIFIEELEDLLDDLDCVELVSRYVGHPKARGRHHDVFGSKCPFCSNSADFVFSADRYHCEACQSWGSAIDFFMEAEECTRRTALVRLREMLNNQELEGRLAGQKKRWTIMAETQRFYHELLMQRSEGAAARTWLLGKGISVETIKDFGLGYAPAQPSSLLSDHLQSKGFDMTTQVELGVVSDDAKGTRDRFFGMLVPLRDDQGRCFGFADPVPGFPQSAGIRGQSIMRTNCISDRRFRRLVLPAPSWPKDFNRYEAALVDGTLWEMLLLHSAGIHNTLCQVGMEPYTMRTAFALSKSVIYLWRAERGSASSLDVITEKAGSEYQKTKLFGLSGDYDLADILQCHGAEAVRMGMSHAISLSEVLAS